MSRVVDRLLVMLHHTDPAMRKSAVEELAAYADHPGVQAALQAAKDAERFKIGVSSLLGASNSPGDTGGQSSPVISIPPTIEHAPRQVDAVQSRIAMPAQPVVIGTNSSAIPAIMAILVFVGIVAAFVVVVVPKSSNPGRSVDNANGERQSVPDQQPDSSQYEQDARRVFEICRRGNGQIPPQWDLQGITVARTITQGDRVGVVAVAEMTNPYGQCPASCAVMFWCQSSTGLAFWDTAKSLMLIPKRPESRIYDACVMRLRYEIQ